MIRVSFLIAFLLLSSVLFAGCIFQKTPVAPAPSTIDQPVTTVAPSRPTSSSPSVSPAPDQSSDEEDSGLPPVSGDEVNEGEEVVQ